MREVSVRDSPVISGRNLTGSPRIIRDTIADIHDDIQKWNKCHIEGIKIIQEIIVMSPRTSNSSQKWDNIIWNLKQLVDKCSSLMKAIESYLERLNGVSKLHKEEEILFSKLSAGKIEQQARIIYEGYSKEFEVKQLVLEHIAFAKSESEAVFFACLWKYQININDLIQHALEDLLIETGHRKIT